MVGTVASQQEGRACESAGCCLHVVFSEGAPAPSHSPATRSFRLIVDSFGDYNHLLGM